MLNSFVSFLPEEFLAGIDLDVVISPLNVAIAQGGS